LLGLALLEVLRKLGSLGVGASEPAIAVAAPDAA
jgi:hypothetical protein